MECSNFFSEVKKDELKGPLYVQWEISGVCVAKCVTCNVHKQNKYHPTARENDLVLRKLHDCKVKSIRFTGGEPLLAPNYSDLIEFCNFYEIQTSIITTLLSQSASVNAALLNTDILKISLSAVGHNYSSFFGIDRSYFNLFDHNLRMLKQEGKEFEIYYTIFDGNCSLKETTNFINYIYKFNPKKVHFFPAMFKEHDREQLKEVLKLIENTATFDNNSSRVLEAFDLRDNLKDIKCHINKFHMYIKSDGRIYPCCMTGGELGQSIDDDIFLMGNAFTDNITGIYKKNYGMMRNLDTNNCSACKDCTFKYKRLNDSYENFIYDKTFKEL